MERYNNPRSAEQPKIFEPEILNNLIRKTQEVNAEHTIDMQPFIDVYGLETVKKDYAEIAERIQGYMEHKLSDGEKMGYIFESAFLDVGTNNTWFGERSELNRASKYDDIKHGVDVIATILTRENSPRHLAIASDLTFSFPGASEKFMRLTDRLRRGQMSQIKYFHSDLLHMTGQIRNIPGTVVGLDVTNLDTFLRGWMNEPELSQKQFGSIILTEIATQCKAFAQMAKSIHGPSDAITTAYLNSAAAIEEILGTEYESVKSPADRINTAISQHSQKLIEEYR